MSRARLLAALCALAAGLASAQPRVPPPAGAAASATARALRAAGIAKVSEDQGTVRATVLGDSLWDIAGATTAGSSVDRNQAMVAIFRANPQAFAGANIHRIEKGVSLVIPSLAEMRAEDPRLAAELVMQHRQAIANRSLAPMVLYATPGRAAPAASAASTPAAASVSKPAVPASMANEPAAIAEPAPPPSSAGRTGAPTASPVQWWPAVVLVALAAAAVALFLRRRTANPFDDEEAAVEHASRMFVDSRIALESQLEVQPDGDSEPLYSTLDEPVDALPPAPTPLRAAPVLVLRNGRAAALDIDPAPPTVGGDALALALTVAHAYADVGRPEASRRWLRAIDARGAAAFERGA